MIADIAKSGPHRTATRTRSMIGLMLMTLMLSVTGAAATGSASAHAQPLSAGPTAPDAESVSGNCAADPGLPNQFADVADDGVFCNDIAWMSAQGITKGRGDGTYGPSDQVLRGHLAAFLHRYAQQPTPPADGATFLDVPESHLFATAIAWLAAEGITTGRPDGAFDPSGHITRGQMAAFLHRYAGEPDLPVDAPGFPDVPDGYIFADAILWLAHNGITNGRDDGTFDPAGALNRGQMSAFLARYHHYLTDTVERELGAGWIRLQHDGQGLGGDFHQLMWSVTAGGPGLVAVGHDLGRLSAAVWTSEQGLAWQRVAHDSEAFSGDGIQWMTSVTSGGPGLVAVGADEGRNQAAVWTTTDGDVWQRVAPNATVFGGEGWQQMNAVSTGGPGLVAVGHDRVGDASQTAAVWTSTDGLVWQRVPHDEETFGDGWLEMTSVATGGPGLVAVGRDESRRAAAVWTSTDGLAWQRVPHDEDMFGGDDHQQMLSVTSGGPGLVAVGQAGRLEGQAASAAVWTSTDGTAWQRVAHDETVFGGESRLRMTSVVAHAEGLVAVGSDRELVPLGVEGRMGAVVWASTDGSSWQRAARDDGIIGLDDQQWMDSVTVVGSRLVAVGGYRKPWSEGGRIAASVWKAP